MAFQLDTEQSVTIGSEAGAVLATGGTYTGAAADVVNTAPVPVTAGVTYALVAPVNVGAVGDTVAWTVEMTSGADVWTETDGYGKDGLQNAADEITGPGVSTREWTPQLTGTARFSIVRT
ncbi:TPA: hypothetical protein OQU49_004392, partial [Shigella flexneri]|nr:hypothetical protein [Shigella flexneri]